MTERSNNMKGILAVFLLLVWICAIGCPLRNQSIDQVRTSSYLHYLKEPGKEFCIGGCKKLLWFMGVQGSHFDYYEYIKAAVLSAQRNAPSLLPVLLYEGDSGNFTDWFESHGGYILYHKLSFSEQLKNASEGMWQIRGAFFRLDVPLVIGQALAHFGDEACVETDYYLYTDTDVLFLQDISSCSFNKPPIYTISAEAHKGTPFNTGVMYANRHGFENNINNILSYADEIKWDVPACDQGLLNKYVEAQNISIPYLHERFNWKPYWGKSDDAVIVHFHGPKPLRCLPCYLKHLDDYGVRCSDACDPAYMPLLDMIPDGGALYQDMAELILDLSANDHSSSAFAISSSV